MSNVFNGERPMLNDLFVHEGNHYRVKAIAPGVVIGRLASVEVAKSHKSLVVIKESFKWWNS